MKILTLLNKNTYYHQPTVMEWQQIINKAGTTKETFDRSYTSKSLNTDRSKKEETVRKHLNILIDCLEKTRDTFFLDIREKLVSVAIRRDILLENPTSIHENIFLGHKEESDDGKGLNMTQTVVEFLNTNLG